MPDLLDRIAAGQTNRQPDLLDRIASQQQAQVPTLASVPSQQNQGLVSKAVEWLKPVLQMQKENVEKIANLSPAQLYGPQEGYARNMAKNVLGMVNPLNAGLAIVAPETLVGRYGQLANAGLRAGGAGLGAQIVGQAAGERLAGVPLPDEQKTQADLGLILGPLMILGASYQKPEAPSLGLGPTAFNDTIGSMLWEKAQAERAKNPVAPVSPPAATAPVVPSQATDVTKIPTPPTAGATAPLNPGGPSSALSPALQAIEAANKAKQQQIAAEFKAKLQGQQAAVPQAMNPVMENLARKVADPTAGRLSMPENKFLSQLVQQNPQLHQQFLARVAQLKEQNAIQPSNAQLHGGLRPRNETEQVGTQVPVAGQSETARVGGSQGQVQRLPAQEKIQAAPQAQVSGAERGALRPGVRSDGQGGRTIDPLAGLRSVEKSTDELTPIEKFIIDEPTELEKARAVEGRGGETVMQRNARLIGEFRRFKLKQEREEKQVAPANETPEQRNARFLGEAQKFMQEQKQRVAFGKKLENVPMLTEQENKVLQGLKKTTNESLFGMLGVSSKVGNKAFKDLTPGQLEFKRKELHDSFAKKLQPSNFEFLSKVRNEAEQRIAKQMLRAKAAGGSVQKSDITGSIFPESQASKAFKESLGAKEVEPQIVGGARARLDSLKSFGNNILDAVTDSHIFKSWMLKRQGYDLPKIEALNPQFANVVAKYANSQVAATLRAHANITRVLGDKANNEQFKKQLGGIIYEDMRRASGDVGNPVFKLKNSPFANEEQYRSALRNPEIQAALGRWKQFVQPLATEMHEKLGGGLAESGKETGAFANLIAVLSEDRTELEPLGNAPSSTGPLATMKRGSAFSKERKFTGQEYNLDAGDMAFRMLTKNAQQASLRDVYSEGEKARLLKLLKPGEETPAGMVRQQNPVTLRSIVTKDAQGNTESANVSRWLAFDKRIAPSMKQALQLNTSWKEALKEGAPALHVASQAIIKTQVGLGIDLGFHTFNDMVAVMNSPKGLLALPSKAIQVAKAQHDLVSNDLAVQEELAKMAETGVSFRGESLGGWSSHALKVADTVTRLVLNREYDTLVKEGTVKDIPAERRRYINGRAGQYNKRFMTWFQQGMQETGLGSFNVAGRNFNRLAVGNLTFSPGVKAASNVDALRLRLSIAAGVATAALILPATVNIMTTGSARPEGTELGDIVLHKNADGRYEVINMRKWTMLARGGRASGLGAVMNEQVLPRLRGEQAASLGQTASDAFKDIGRTAVAPFSGPPLNLLSVGLTGRTEGGLGYEQRTPGEKPPYVEAMLGQLNPLVGPLVQQGQGATAAGRLGQRLGSIVGVQASQAPFSIIRNRATQWKVANNIHTDEASFAPSEYLPLKQALLIGKIDTAKQEYQQLISEKANQHPSLNDDEAKHEAQMDLQREFSKLENFRFVNKENEEKFKASLSPEQRKMYDLAVQQQKDIAAKFFSEIQGKIDNKKPTGFRPPTFRKARGFSNQF